MITQKLFLKMYVLILGELFWFQLACDEGAQLSSNIIHFAANIGLSHSGVTEMFNIIYDYRKLIKCYSLFIKLYCTVTIFVPTLLMY